MANITHVVGVKADQEKVFEAVTNTQGLAKWWTNDVSGSGEAGGTLQFRFNGEGPDMKVVAANADRVEWECVSGPEEWLGTQIVFDIKKEAKETEIYFQHNGWTAETPFHYHCSMKWAVFMLSLKDYLDSGQGKAFPNDIQINTLNG